MIKGKLGSQDYGSLIKMIGEAVRMEDAEDQAGKYRVMTLPDGVKLTFRNFAFLGSETMWSCIGFTLPGGNEGTYTITSIEEAK